MGSLRADFTTIIAPEATRRRSFFWRCNPLWTCRKDQVVGLRASYSEVEVVGDFRLTLFQFPIEGKDELVEDGI